MAARLRAIAAPMPATRQQGLNDIPRRIVPLEPPVTIASLPSCGRYVGDFPKFVDEARKKVGLSAMLARIEQGLEAKKIQQQEILAEMCSQKCTFTV